MKHTLQESYEIEALCVHIASVWKINIRSCIGHLDLFTLAHENLCVKHICPQKSVGDEFTFYYYIFSAY